MRIVVLGPPGAGKGTQCRLLEQRLGVPQVSTGDMLRAVVRSESPLGNEVKYHMERGELVPDAVMVALVEERLEQPDCADGFLLDGFPRNLNQVSELERLLADKGAAIDAAISFEVPYDELIRRLSGRRTCEQCHRMYHVELSPPRAEGICDQCGGELFQREDDREETIRARLDVYRRQAAPMREYFRAVDALREIDGVGPAAEVHARILEGIRPAT